MDPRDFYDDFVDRQVATGVNARHRSILRWLRRFGLAEGDRVLEIGCGVGTVTELVADALGPGGHLLGVDLSPRSIAAARERLDGREGVELRAGDVLEMDLDGPFDVVVLPDVIEHIPLDLHPRLFRRVAEWVDAEGFVLLHYPNPRYLTWCRQHRPELLQVIDQPVHADGLTAAAYGAGLHLVYLETYAIWVEEGDYEVAVLRRDREEPTFTDIVEEPSLLDRLRSRLGRVTG